MHPFQIPAALVPAVQSETAGSIIPIFAAGITATAVVFAAVFATVVGLMNWKTAKDKLFIDLFDRRLVAYGALNEKIRATALHIESSDAATLAFGGNIHSYFTELYDAFSKTHFLFGPEIVEYLQRVDKALVAANWAKIRNEQPEDGGQFPKAYMEIIALQRKLPEIFEPYMDMRRMGVRKSPTRKERVMPVWKGLGYGG